jgi:hypothetical protein
MILFWGNEKFGDNDGDGDTDGDAYFLVAVL